MTKRIIDKQNEDMFIKKNDELFSYNRYEIVQMSYMGREVICSLL